MTPGPSLFEQVLNYRNGRKLSTEGRDAVFQALQRVARGMTLRQGECKHGAPCGSSHRAWVAVKGNIDGAKWQAFKASGPLLAEENSEDDAADAPRAGESPLGLRLKQACQLIRRRRAHGRPRVGSPVTGPWLPQGCRCSQGSRGAAQSGAQEAERARSASSGALPEAWQRRW